MILRRLTDAFRKQVNNWNERLDAASREANLIGQLHNAFVVENENVRDGAEYIASHRRSTDAVLIALSQDQPPADAEAFSEDLLMSAQPIGPVFEVPIVSVMMSTGDLAELSSPELRNALMDYHFQIEALKMLSDNQMQMLSDLSNGAQTGLRIVTDDETGFYRISGYDFEAVKSARGFYQSQLATQYQILGYVGDLEKTTATIVEELERQQQ